MKSIFFSLRGIYYMLYIKNEWRLFVHWSLMSLVALSEWIVGFVCLVWLSSDTETRNEELLGWAAAAVVRPLRSCLPVRVYLFCFATQMEQQKQQQTETGGKQIWQHLAPCTWHLTTETTWGLDRLHTLTNSGTSTTPHNTYIHRISSTQLSAFFRFVFLSYLFRFFSCFEFGLTPIYIYIYIWEDPAILSCCM